MQTQVQQLHSIQAMLAAGHRCVTLERHSLLLWGMVGGGLSAFTDLAINHERFPDTTQHAVALLVWLAFWLGGMSWLDHWLTRRARLARDETLPFAQSQVTRAWWMLLALGTLSTFAMFFHGGGAMIYALWTVLLGLGIFIFGLFSRPLVEWIGFATILLGIVGLASGLPIGGASWLTASCFAIGLPLTGWLTAKTDDRLIVHRLLALTLWLVAVTVPALAAARLMPLTATPSPTTAILALPAGTTIPLRFDLDSPLVAVSPDAAVPIRLTRDTEIALANGQPEGRFRIDGGPWHAVGEGALYLRIDRVRPRITNGQAEIRMHGDFTLKGEQP